MHSRAADGSIRKIKNELSPTTVFGDAVGDWNDINERTWPSHRTITAPVAHPVPPNGRVTMEWKQKMVRLAHAIGLKLCDGLDVAYQVLPGNMINLHDQIELRILVCKRNTTPIRLVSNQFNAAAASAAAAAPKQANIVSLHSIWPSLPEM